MKKRMLLVLNIIGIMALAGCDRGAEENINTSTLPMETESFEESSMVETSMEESSIEESSMEEVTTVEDGEIVSSGNDVIDQQVLSTVQINDGEMLENQGWLDETMRCYRVKIAYLEQPEKGYQHVRDYFFFTEAGVEPLTVTYTNGNNTEEDEARYVYAACDFLAYLEDVTFDGKDDLIISLGCLQTDSKRFNCAYIYEDGAYVYNQDFEEIPNYMIYEEGKVINSWNIQGAIEYLDSYSYDASEKTFVKTDSVELEPNIARIIDLYNHPVVLEQVPEFMNTYQRTNVHTSHAAQLKLENVDREGFDFSIEAQYYFHSGEVHGRAYYTSEHSAVFCLTEMEIPLEERDYQYVLFYWNDGEMKITATSNSGRMGLGQNVSVNGVYTFDSPMYTNENILNETYTQEQLDFLKENLSEEDYDRLIFATQFGSVSVNKEDGTTLINTFFPTDSSYDYTVAMDGENINVIVLGNGNNYIFGIDEDVE